MSTLWTEEPRPLRPGWWSTLEALLGESRAVLDRVREGAGLAGLSRTLLLCIVAGAAAFGAAMGSYRGGVQILYAGIKLPLVILLTAGLCAPALSCFNAALGRPARAARDMALVLAALARAAVVLAALAPLLLLCAKWELDYHRYVLLVVICCAMAGAVGVFELLRGLWRQHHRGLIWMALLLLGLSSSVGTQMAWTFRPYVVRPRTVEVPFIRDLEGSFLGAVQTTERSAWGLYERDMAPLPGEAQEVGP